MNFKQEYVEQYVINETLYLIGCSTECEFKFLIITLISLINIRRSWFSILCNLSMER